MFFHLSSWTSGLKRAGFEEGVVGVTLELAGFSQMHLFSHAFACYLFGPVWRKATHLKLEFLMSQAKCLTFFLSLPRSASLKTSLSSVDGSSLLQAETLGVPDASPSYISHQAH